MEDELEQMQSGSGVDLKSRPEVLTREQFRAMSRELTALGH
jgi:hypothetical protein